MDASKIRKMNNFEKSLFLKFQYLCDLIGQYWKIQHGSLCSSTHNDTAVSQRSFFFQATLQQDSQKLDKFFKVKITLTPVHNIFLFFLIFFSSGTKFLIWNLLIEKNWEQKNTLISSNIFSVWNFMWWCHFYFTVKRKLHINWCFVCKLLCASCQNTTFKIKHMAITKSL